MPNTSIRRAVLVMLASALVAGPALADKPDHAGGKGHGKKRDDDRDGKGGKRNEERREVRVGGYFNERDRKVVGGYYEEERGHGRKHCPPGLAKKNNGCMPPGQAKKYMVGQPLPVGVVYYPVPQPVLVQLPPPPVGHKYVRVAADILLIAVGTSMVVDAMGDLAR